MKIKSKNNVEIEIKKIKIPKNKQKSWTGTEEWKATVNEEYFLNINNAIGKFYGLDFRKEFKSFEEFVEVLKNIYVTKFSRLFGEQYTIETYDITKDNFEEVKKEWKFICDEGEKLGYSEEYGVGYFIKKGKGYEGHHFRYGNENITKYKNFDEVVEFLRSFCEIGYSLQADW